MNADFLFWLKTAILIVVILATIPRFRLADQAAKDGRWAQGAYQMAYVAATLAFWSIIL